jgi:lysophospholipase L1-like esterase
MKRYQTWAGVILLAVVAILAGLSSGRAEDKPDFSRWESAIAAFEKQDRENPPPKNAFLFVGSSSIRLWDLNKSFPGMDVINRGFGGSQLADSVHFAPRLVLKHEPRMVLLYAGDNDLALGKTPEQVHADFKDFVKVVHDKFPKTRIAFLSIKPSVARWRLIDKVRKANALIEAECKADDRMVFIDVGKPLLDDDGKPRKEFFVFDGLHLNARGYEAWAAVVRPYLK